MAVVTVNLQPFNNLTLAAGNEYNLIAPTVGNYLVYVLNLGNADIAISNANTVGLSDPNSYLLPGSGGNAPSLGFPVPIWGPTGVWVAGSGAISVALMPR